MIELSIQRVPETDEYAVTWKVDGKLIEEQTYYTNDLEDARLTLSATIERVVKQGYPYCIRTNSLTGPFRADKWCS